jgi:diguanylate cyclase (GGDEF)-like protein
MRCRRHPVLVSAFGLMGAMIAATAVYAVTGPHGGALERVMHTWIPSITYVLAAGIVAVRVLRNPDRRGPWLIIAIGLTLYVAGNLVWSFWLEYVPAPPIPSISDGLWLALYPASYIGVVWLARSGEKRASAGAWLDGIVAGLGVTTIGAALVAGPIFRSATGSVAAVATNLAYPVGDLLLAGLVVGLLALRGWRVDRLWGMLGAGFLLLCVADIVYLLHVAAGITDSSSVANVFYLTGVAFLAGAAWQPASKPSAPRLHGWSMVAVPGAFALVAAGVPLYDHFADVHLLGVIFATLTLLAALTRTALTFRDVRSLAETKRQATTDELTSLPNRRRLLERVTEELAGARESGEPVALLLIDLDHFKELNDTLGHHAGDGLLRQIGPRLEKMLGSKDMLARLGGDEFALLLAAPCDEESARIFADNVRDSLRAPFAVEALHLSVGASIGIALHTEQADTAERLLQCADIAMYQAKGARSGSEVYALERDRHSRDSLALAAELPAAIEEGQLEVHFQPKADSVSRSIVGVEALVRWRHPRLGLLAPATFLPLAEQAGVVREITRCVITQAFAARRRWSDAGCDLHVSVNASVADLMDAAFPLEVASSLATYGVPANAVAVEITESSVMSDPVRIGHVLDALRDLDIVLSLDDFGTGYSSLTHLRSLPVTEVKIDRSFVNRMCTDPADGAIVRTTIDLAHSLGMHVVAEGVEDDQTWDALVALGCEQIQGYRLSKPLPAAELEALLGLAVPVLA